MEKSTSVRYRTLAEVLRLQRWAGGEHVPADRIFGLVHGFETTIRQETESFGISERTQNKVEDILEGIGAEKQSPDGPSLKDRLHRDGINETDALRVMELCRLQSRFVEEIQSIATAPGSIFRQLNRTHLPEQDWFGALHYVELVDGSAADRPKLFAVFAPTVPKAGEIVMPERGSAMEVIQVEHHVISQTDDGGISQRLLVPHVVLMPVDESAD